MKVFIYYSTAGEGHKRVAEAIQKELALKPGVAASAMDAFEHAGRLFRYSYPLTYFYLVKVMPKIWGAIYEATDFLWSKTFLKPIRTAWNRFQSKVLRKFVVSQNPDVIISTHFYAAEIFASAKKRGEIKSRLITVVTDVIPHSFWVNSGTDLYWVMAEESKKDLVARGILENQIQVGGIPIGEEFRGGESREKLEDNLRLTHSRFNILFSSGSFGIGPTQEWLQEVSEFGDKIQALVVCGRNRTLYDTLAKQRYTFPVVLMGFVNNMHELMSVSDILIAKSGGATMCESLAKKLPMLISAPIPGQETRNAQWLIQNEAGIEIKYPGELKGLILRFLNNKLEIQKLKDKIGRIAKPNAAQDIANFVVQN